MKVWCLLGCESHSCTSYSVVSNCLSCYNEVAVFVSDKIHWSTNDISLILNKI